MIKNKVSFWQDVFTAGIDPANPHLYTRLLLINGILFTVLVLLAFFSLFHVLVTGYTQVFVIDFVAMWVIGLLIYDLRRRHCYRLTGHLTAIVAGTFFLVFMPFTQNNDFSFVWMFFFPFFVVLTNGWRIAMLYVAVFYGAFFTMAYLGIGEWQQDAWNELSFLRFVFALIFGMVLAVMIDIAQELSNNREIVIRQKERVYLNELQRLSITDGLTTLYNRHYFNQVIPEKVAEIQDSDLYVSFFILDIDNFKRYNDAFGHQKGDEALQLIANTVQQYIKRENDLVFRLGGEEFGGIVITDDPQSNANWLAKLTQAVEALKIPHAPDAGVPYVTISIGIVSTKVNAQQTMKGLYKMADDALYQAKERGRNQAVIMQPQVIST